MAGLTGFRPPLRLGTMALFCSEGSRSGSEMEVMELILPSRVGSVLSVACASTLDILRGLSQAAHTPALLWGILHAPETVVSRGAARMGSQPADSNSGSCWIPTGWTAARGGQRSRAGWGDKVCQMGSTRK